MILNTATGPSVDVAAEPLDTGTPEPMAGQRVIRGPRLARRRRPLLTPQVRLE